jgi:hypothetical protein
VYAIVWVSPFILEGLVIQYRKVPLVKDQNEDRERDEDPSHQYRHCEVEVSDEIGWVCVAIK